MRVEAQETFTDTTMQDEPTDFQNLFVHGKRERLPESTERIYISHPVFGRYAVAVVSSNEVVNEVTEEELGFPGDVVVLLANRPHYWSRPEPEAESWRGVFSPTHYPKVLFTQSVDIATAKLPRLRPQVTLKSRMLSREEDD